MIMQTAFGGERGRSNANIAWPSAARAWWAVFVLLVCYLLMFLDRNILALVVGPIRQDLGVTDTQVGLLLGPVFGLFYTVLTVPFGWLVDRTNRRNIILFGVTFWGAMTVCAGYAATFGELAGARVGLALGEAALMPSVFSLLGDYFPPETRGRAVGVFGTGGFVGIGAANFVGGGILHMFGGPQATLPLVGTIAVWKAVLILVGSGTLIAAILMLSVREAPRAHIALSRSTAGKGESVLKYMGRHRRAFTYVYLAYGCVALIAFGWFAWIPSYFVRQFSMPPANVGIAIGAVSAVAGAIGCVIGGFIADRWTRNKVLGGKFSVLLILWAGWIPAVCGLLFFNNYFVSLVSVGLFMLADGIGLIQFGAVIQDMVPAPLRGRAVSVWYLVTGVIGTLGPILIPLVNEHVLHSDQSMRFAIAAVTVPVILLGLLMSVLGRRWFDQARLMLVPSGSGTDAR